MTCSIIGIVGIFYVERLVFLYFVDLLSVSFKLGWVQIFIDLLCTLSTFQIVVGKHPVWTSESSKWIAQGTAARVGLKALKENTRRSIKRMVSVSQHNEGGVDLTGEQEPGRSSDISENTRSGDEMVVRKIPISWNYCRDWNLDTCLNNYMGCCTLQCLVLRAQCTSHTIMHCAYCIPSACCLPLYVIKY